MKRYIRKFREELTAQAVASLLKKNGIPAAGYRTTPGKFKMVDKSGFKIEKAIYDRPYVFKINILKTPLERITTKELMDKIELILKNNNMDYKRKGDYSYFLIK